MPAVDVYGLRVEWRAPALPRDPVARLLGGFAASTANGTADVTIRIEPDRGVLDASGFRPSFFQGNVRALQRRGALLLVTPGARVLVAHDGGRIDVEGDIAGLDPRGFAGTTLFIALSIALRHWGLFHLHGGALIRGDGLRVLVLGDSGAGKSTVTLSLLDEGARHLGDDALFLTERAGRATLLAFPRPFHLGDATAAAFPALTRGEHDASGKGEVPLEALPWNLAPEMAPPDVVLFPCVTVEPDTRVVTTGPAEAFGRTLASCALVVADGVARPAEQLRLIGALVDRACSYEVRMGSDWLADVGQASALVRRECLPPRVDGPPHPTR
jgi:hypothetical protein